MIAYVVLNDFLSSMNPFISPPKEPPDPMMSYVGAMQSRLKGRSNLGKDITINSLLMGDIIDFSKPPPSCVACHVMSHDSPTCEE